MERQLWPDHFFLGQLPFNREEIKINLVGATQAFYSQIFLSKGSRGKICLNIQRPRQCQIMADPDKIFKACHRTYSFKQLFLENISPGSKSGV